MINEKTTLAKKLVQVANMAKSGRFNAYLARWGAARPGYRIDASWGPVVRVCAPWCEYR